jgi:hypothetical protein
MRMIGDRETAEFRAKREVDGPPCAIATGPAGCPAEAERGMVVIRKVLKRRTRIEPAVRH